MESEKKNIENQRLLTRFEAADRLRVSLRMVDYQVKQGKIRAVRFGRKVLFTVQAIQEFIEANQTRPLGQG